MKKVLISWFLAAVILFSSIAATATGTPSAKQDAASPDPYLYLNSQFSDEELAYKTYFISGSSLFLKAYSACKNIEMFMNTTQRISSLKGKDFSFLTKIKSPLELSSDEIQTMFNYYNIVKKDDVWGYTADLATKAATNLMRTVPNLVLEYTRLEKPKVPEKSSYCDVYISGGFSEVITYFEGCLSFLKGEGEKPSFNDAFYHGINFILDNLE